jgi:hypothetical protein
MVLPHASTMLSGKLGNHQQIAQNIMCALDSANLFRKSFKEDEGLLEIVASMTGQHDIRPTLGQGNGGVWSQTC